MNPTSGGKQATWTLTGEMERLESAARAALVPAPPFPQNLMVELSNACNHACVFCANPKMTRSRKLMSTPLLGSILAQARELGSTSVGFYTTGDPFVHKDLAAFIRQAKQLGYEYTYLSTNGALATPARAQAAIEAGLDSIKFSINAGSRETYQAVHGRDDWDVVIRNLRFIAELRRTLERPLRLGITYVVIDQNRHEQEPFARAFGMLVDDIYFSQSDVQQGYMQENSRFVATESTATPMQAPCYMVFGRAHVSCEGYLTLCCVDYQNYLAVADLNVTPLGEAWNAPAFREMRERHLRNELEGTLCWNCIHQQQRPVDPLVPELATIMDFAVASEANLKRQRDRFVPLSIAVPARQEAGAGGSG